MLILQAMLIGFVLDLLFGDPVWLPHPVVGMGKCITWYERRIRPLFPPTPRFELWGGALLTVSLTLLSFLLPWGLCPSSGCWNSCFSSPLLGGLGTPATTQGGSPEPTPSQGAGS